MGILYSTVWLYRMSVKEARGKILNLAAEVAETEDYNVPIRLKQLQGIPKHLMNFNHK